MRDENVVICAMALLAAIFLLTSWAARHQQRVNLAAMEDLKEQVRAEQEAVAACGALIDSLEGFVIHFEEDGP